MSSSTQSATRTTLTLGPTNVIPCFVVSGKNSAEVGWNPATRTFSGEASTMRWARGSVALRSARTGELRFFDNATPAYIDGDLTHWTLTSRDGLSLVIFND